MSKSLWNQKGQALIESALSLNVLLLAIGAIVLMSYRGALYYFADYQMHEALVCLDDESLSRCRQKFEHSLNKVRIGNFKYDFRLRRFGKSGRAILEVKLSPPLKIEKSVSYPLSGS